MTSAVGAPKSSVERQFPSGLDPSDPERAGPHRPAAGREPTRPRARWVPTKPSSPSYSTSSSSVTPAVAAPSQDRDVARGQQVMRPVRKEICTWDEVGGSHRQAGSAQDMVPAMAFESKLHALATPTCRDRRAASRRLCAGRSAPRLNCGHRSHRHLTRPWRGQDDAGRWRRPQLKILTTASPIREYASASIAAPDVRDGHVGTNVHLPVVVILRPPGLTLVIARVVTCTRGELRRPQDRSVRRTCPSWVRRTTSSRSSSARMADGREADARPA